MAQCVYNSGPDSARVAEAIRKDIDAGVLPAGQFVPCTRDLGERHAVSPETVRRALKMLEQQKGMVVSVPRHGFKVVRRSRDKQSPILAYVLPQWSENQRRWVTEHMLGVFQKVADRMGTSLFAVGGGSNGELAERIKAIGATGVLLDDTTSHVIDTLQGLGLPTVVVDDWDAAGRFDGVCQDNFGGALQVIDYLAGRGHTKIVWIGPAQDTVWAAERWGGVMVGAQRRGLAIPRKLGVEGTSQAAFERLKAVMSGANRPTAIVALWGDIAGNSARVVTEAGLTVGRDLEIVGWTAKEDLGEYAARFPEERFQAAVLWSIQDMAEVAISRLLERKVRPELPKVRINVETRMCSGV